MIIDKVDVSSFRGFQGVSFPLGEYVTLIAGQNGTQKSTLLGILTQTFTIPRAGHPFSKERPLTGGSFRSAFKDKFKLSPNLDEAGTHLWTLYFHDKNIHPDIDEEGGFTIESIVRTSDKEGLRFWQKGRRDAGSGYVQLPVIFLSLKRLIPIAEAGQIKEDSTIMLTQEEQQWFSEAYNKILLSRDNLTAVDYLVSSNKNTLGVTTDHYDWNSNSAGQDNIGRILLAIISFQRLKKKYPHDYQGGILAIDEIDATLYPASQVKLLEFLSSIAKKIDVQLLATTHSLHLLEKAFELKAQRGRTKQFNVIYLKKINGEVGVEECPSFESVAHNLNVTTGTKRKSPKKFVYTEDKECIHFAKAIIGRRFQNLKFPEITLGCGNLIQLGQKKIDSFTYPNSIVVLDGDARNQVKKTRLKNYICLPGNLSPEVMLANFLVGLPDDSAFWEEKLPHYSKQVCFRDYSLDEISTCRIKAKGWYNQQLDLGAWGRQAGTAFKYLLAEIPDEKSAFLDQFEKIYEAMV